MYTQYTLAQKKQKLTSIRNLVRKGATIRAAADQVGVSISSLTNWRNQLGFNISARPTTKTRTVRKFAARSRH